MRKHHHLTASALSLGSCALLPILSHEHALVLCAGVRTVVASLVCVAHVGCHKTAFFVRSHRLVVFLRQPLLLFGIICQDSHGFHVHGCHSSQKGLLQVFLHHYLVIFVLPVLPRSLLELLPQHIHLLLESAHNLVHLRFDSLLILRFSPSRLGFLVLGDPGPE